MMISKKSGFIMPLAMVFATGVGAYIISIGVTLNDASHKVVRMANISKFNQIVTFFENNNSLYKDLGARCSVVNEGDAVRDIRGVAIKDANGNDLEAQNVIGNCLSLPIAGQERGLIPSEVITLLKNSLQYPVNYIAGDTISISPGVSITAPGIDPINSRSMGKNDRFSHIFITFSKISSCVDSLSIIDKYAIAGYSPGHGSYPTGLFLREVSTNPMWKQFPNWNDSVFSIHQLCGMIDNNNLWVHYEV
jgi:hypothetical protein